MWPSDCTGRGQASPIAIQKNEQCFLEEAGLAEPRLWVLPGQAGFCLTPLFPLEIEGEKGKKKQTKPNPNFVLCIFNFLSLRSPNKDMKGSGFLVAAPAGVL